MTGSLIVHIDNVLSFGSEKFAHFYISHHLRFAFFPWMALCNMIGHFIIMYWGTIITMWSWHVRTTQPFRVSHQAAEWLVSFIWTIHFKLHLLFVLYADTSVSLGAVTERDCYRQETTKILFIYQKWKVCTLSVHRGQCINTLRE